MSIASSIFNRFKAQRATATRPARQAYVEFLKELASGGECDLESLELCCASLDIDESKLEADIATMANRLASAQRMSDSANAEPKLYETQAKMQRIVESQREFLAKTTAELATLRSEELYLMQTFVGSAHAKQTLRETVLDGDLLDRMREHEATTQKLLVRQRAIEAEMKAPFGCCWKVAQAERNLENIRNGFKDIFSTRRREIPKWEAQLKEFQPLKRELEQKLQDIHDERREHDAEGAQIESEKLKP